MIELVVLPGDARAPVRRCGRRGTSEVGDRLGRARGLLLRRRIGGRERVGDGVVVRAVRVVDAERAECFHEARLRARERYAVLRAARTRKRRLDVAEVELDDLRVRRVRTRVVPEEVLLAVRLDERDALRDCGR